MLLPDGIRINRYWLEGPALFISRTGISAFMQAGKRYPAEAAMAALQIPEIVLMPKQKLLQRIPVQAAARIKNQILPQRGNPGIQQRAYRGQERKKSP
jgi:hypothetical protein